METIEQAQNRLESLSMDGKNGFYRGVLWSQRWIPIEEEQPTKGIEIIAKNKHRKVVYEIRTNDDIKYICETFTHWRPIERV